MPPSPCQHCGNNFMPSDPNAEGLRLCNNCIVKNELRNLKEKKMENDFVNILIKFPKEIQAKIEEDCVAKGIDFSKFFLELYELSIQEHYIYRDPDINFKIEERNESTKKKGKKNE